MSSCFMSINLILTDIPDFYARFAVGGGRGGGGGGGEGGAHKCGSYDYVWFARSDFPLFPLDRLLLYCVLGASVN